jgi:hypothetical protein
MPCIVTQNGLEMYVILEKYTEVRFKTEHNTLNS